MRIGNHSIVIATCAYRRHEPVRVATAMGAAFRPFSSGPLLPDLLAVLHELERAWPMPHKRICVGNGYPLALWGLPMFQFEFMFQYVHAEVSVHFIARLRNLDNIYDTVINGLSGQLQQNTP